MSNLKGSKTEANLMAAFAGESQARNKYTYYASQAKKDGYNPVSYTHLRPRYLVQSKATFSAPSRPKASISAATNS